METNSPKKIKTLSTTYVLVIWSHLPKTWSKLMARKVTSCILKLKKWDNTIQGASINLKIMLLCSFKPFKGKTMKPEKRYTYIPAAVCSCAAYNVNKNICVMFEVGILFSHQALLSFNRFQSGFNLL